MVSYIWVRQLLGLLDDDLMGVETMTKVSGNLVNELADILTPPRSRLETAFKSPCFPCNPIPFANGLADHIRTNGTDSIKSDSCKAILWILMAQAYGQVANIDLMREFDRLDKVIE